MLSVGGSSLMVDSICPVNVLHPLAQGLIGFWLGLPGQASGPRVNDLAGRRQHGTLTNGPTWTTGPTGFGAVAFDGVNDHVALGDVANLTKAGSVFAFAKVTAGLLHTDDIGIVCKDDATVNLQYKLACGSNSAGNPYALRFGAKLGGAFTDRDSDSVNGWNPGLWTLAGWTYNGRSTVGYKNGAPLTLIARVAGSADGDFNANTTPLNFAARNNGASIFANCQIESAFVWNRGLASDEARLLYEEVSQGYPNLLRRWSRRVYAVEAAAVGNRRRRVLISGGAA